MKPVIVMTDSKGLTTNNATIIHLPLIEIVPLPVIDLSRHHFDWLLFTSSNAVTLFFERYAHIQYDKVASIGRKTAETLERMNIHVDYMPNEAVQEALIHEAGHCFDLQHVCLPCSAQARPLLRNYLQTVAELTEIPLYRTAANQSNADRLHELITNSQVDVVTFMSPSAVNSYFEHYPPFNQPIIAIGKVTGRALEAVGQPYILSDEASKEAMIQKIIEMRNYNEI